MKLEEYHSARFVDIPTTCKLTGLGKSCITNNINKGIIHAMSVHRKLLIPNHELERYLESEDYKRTKAKSLCYGKETNRKGGCDAKVD